MFNKIVTVVFKKMLTFIFLKNLKIQFRFQRLQVQKYQEFVQ